VKSSQVEIDQSYYPAYLFEFCCSKLGFSFCATGCPALEDRILVLLPKGAIVICGWLVAAVTPGHKTVPKSPGLQNSTFLNS